MSTDTVTLAGQLLTALKTKNNLPDVMEKILDEAKNSQNRETYVQQVISEVQVYPGTDLEDERRWATALLQQLLEYAD